MRLAKLMNVHFLGFKAPSQLPNYIKGMDVCIMPSVKSKLVDAVFPLKLFEYLSSGKPIVSTSSTELMCYSYLISLADTSEEFQKAITEALNENEPEKVNARIEAAKANTWDVRIEEISELVEETLKRKRSFITSI